MTIVHIRIDKAAPQTACGRDVADKAVAWTRPSSFPELLNGEILGIQPCPTCIELVSRSSVTERSATW